jgi:hypothetical protein
VEQADPFVDRLVMLWLWLACASRAPVRMMEMEPVSVAGKEERVPAGTVGQGRFVDGRHGYSIGVPQGWQATTGYEGGAHRLRLHDPETDAWVEVRVPPRGVPIGPRAGCVWTFEDRARYRVLPGQGPVQTATCMPDEPSDRRIFAYVSRLDGRVVVVEVHAPGDQLVAAKRAGDHVVSTYRWQDPPNGDGDQAPR